MHPHLRTLLRAGPLLATLSAMTQQPLALSATPLTNAATAGDLMSPPIGVFTGEMTVAETVEALRELTQAAVITYCYVTGEGGKLEGVVVMRDMLLATPETKLEDLMLRDVFSLPAAMPLGDALKAALNKHYPVYPVCDESGVLRGLIRGDELFAEQAIEISAQAGKMVGVEKEERMATPVSRSLKLRHPWLQLNLLTAFIAAAVVGLFEETLSQLVILAVFLPVMAGQSGNTGCQALAVALRGMTLGEIKGLERRLVVKEGTLGFFNGLFVGVTAGLGMLVYATMQGEAQPILMGLVVMVAMVVSCVAAGLAGALIPLTLKRLGADPATASSIFLTTASDVASMGVFLSLSTILLL
jgi:magnesium transporter